VCVSASAASFDEWCFAFAMCVARSHRSGRRGDRAVTRDAAGDEPLHVRGVREGVPAAAGLDVGFGVLLKIDFWCT
jgi:hypothetical protein